eukprot:CAMPEP_0196139080 /NCGR_PEP_ID=MMETSP0910-20130528/6485_1 /TAXON_ID=49265 /ORGANISM="Thalassiosira rotula, Strain GSO102" /LENGTH=208 /DNA_ID=CAMNT_0041399763 /DNA_START=14 /DNA_END=640 /DNA_ORIENTATION=+
MAMKPIQRSFRHPRRQNNNITTTSSFLLLIILSLLFSTTTKVLAQAQQQQQKQAKLRHGGGLWGTMKETIYEPIIQPATESIVTKYNDLSDEGRFVASACVGFGASKVAIRATVNTVKTVGAAYIAFEALEYCGLLQEARSYASPSNQKLLAKSRDYVLRTVDGIRHDIRTQLLNQPNAISKKIKASMERDKPGTVGFSTGAFLGFAL